MVGAAAQHERVVDAGLHYELHGEVRLAPHGEGLLAVEARAAVVRRRVAYPRRVGGPGPRAVRGLHPEGQPLPIQHRFFDISLVGRVCGLRGKYVQRVDNSESALSYATHFSSSNECRLVYNNFPRSYRWLFVAL